MLLAVDIGNTSTKFGIFDGESLLSKFSIPTNKEFTAYDLKSLIGSELTITNAVVCSVVPHKEILFTDVLRNAYGVEALITNNDLDFGLKINYFPRSSIGTDRLINSFAAVEKYGEPFIICSFGTATTFDVVDRNRELLGGAIAPGMKTMAKALHSNTAKLPEIEIDTPENIIGNTTVESIRSGIFYGHVAMIEGLINRIKKACCDAQVIATGGFAYLIAEHTESINVVDENLLLDGLRLCHERFNN